MTLIFLIFAGLLAVPVKGQGRLTMPQYLQDPNTDDESGGLTEMNGGPSGGIVPFQMPQMGGRFPGPQGSSPFSGSQGPNFLPGSQGPSPFSGSQGPFPSQSMGMSPNRGMFGGRAQAGMGNDDNSLFLPSDPFQDARAQNSFPMRQGQQGGMNPFSSMPTGTSRIVTFPQMSPQGSSSQQGGNNFGQRILPFGGQNGAPFDSNFGQNFGQSSPNFGQSGPNFAQSGPNFGQSGPNFAQSGLNSGQSGPNFGQGGPPFGQNGSPFGQNGSPFGQNGLQNRFQGSPFGQGGSSNDFSDSPFDQIGFQGSPSGQGGFPGSSFGQPGLQGSPFSQFGSFSPRGPQGSSFSGRSRPNMNEDDFSDGLSGGQRSLNGMRPFSLGRPDNEGNTNPYIPGVGFVRGINGMGPGGPNSNQAGNFNSQRGQIPDYDADQNGINDGKSDIGGPLCPNKMGMYGDPQTSCSVYYMCQRDGRRDTYSCPTTTKFNNKIGVCDYATNVDDNCNPLSDASEQSSKRRYISPSSSEKSKDKKTKNISKKSDSKKESKDQ